MNALTAFEIANAPYDPAAKVFGRAVVKVGDRVRVATGTLCTDDNFRGPVEATVTGKTAITVDTDMAIIDLIDPLTQAPARVSTRNLTLIEKAVA